MVGRQRLGGESWGGVEDRLPESVGIGTCISPDNSREGDIMRRGGRLLILS